MNQQIWVTLNLLLIEITHNLNIDCCNIFFCICLAGLPAYSEKTSISNNLNSTSTINWVEHSRMSKSDLVNTKYGISKINMILARLVILAFLTLSFFILPDAAIYILKIFGILPETIENNKLKYSFISQS